jgi:ribonuclease HI
VVGLIQTAYRAELFAVMVALEYAMARHACVRVWTDCQSVIDAFEKYVCEGTVV